LLDKTGESTIRLVVGKHTVVVQTEKEETVAVVLPTGHAIAKSLRRMIRRMSRKVRTPIRPSVAPPHLAPTSPAPRAQPATTTGPAPQQGASADQEEQEQRPDANAPRPETHSPWG
jgi:hypothetical protein